MEFRVAQGEPWAWQIWECVVGVKTSATSWWSHRTHLGGLRRLPEQRLRLWSPEPISERPWGLFWKKHSNFIIQADTTFQSLPTDPAYEVNFILLITFHLIPAKGMAFHEALAKFHQAIIGANMPIYYAGYMPFGVGGEGEYLFYRPSW